MTIPETKIAFRMVIPADDCERFEAVVTTLLDIAYVLPSTDIDVAPNGDQIVTVGVADDYHYGYLVDRIRELADEYERLLDQRD